MRLQKISAALAVLAIAASLSAAQAADKVRVAVATVYVPFAPIFVAQELGFYKEMDLEVEATVYRGGGPAQEAMAAGAADILTNSPMGAALAISKGIKQKVVAAGGTVTPGGWYIVVRKDSGIKSMKDLDGKKVGVTGKGSTTDFFALWAAKNAGITVQTIPLGGNGLLPAIKNSQVDAIVLWPTFSFRALKDSALTDLVDLGKVMPPVVPDSVVASQEMIDKRPDVLKRYLQALMKAVDYMQKHEDYTKKFLAKYANESDPDVLDRAYREVMMEVHTDAMVKPEWIKTSLGLMQLLSSDPTPPVEAVFTDKFLPVKQ
jgi:ABC-type nitrate/sulfonate/bicarbonate transport system substrate-binding protein